MDFKQADRLPTDGPISVNRAREGHISVSVSTDGTIETITMSEYNAARAVALLAFMLEIRLPNAVSKAIKL